MLGSMNELSRRAPGWNQSPVTGRAASFGKSPWWISPSMMPMPAPVTVIIAATSKSQCFAFIDHQSSGLLGQLSRGQESDTFRFSRSKRFFLAQTSFSTQFRCDRWQADGMKKPPDS